MKDGNGDDESKRENAMNQIKTRKRDESNQNAKTAAQNLEPGDERERWSGQQRAASRGARALGGWGAAA